MFAFLLKLLLIAPSRLRSRASSGVRRGSPHSPLRGSAALGVRYICGDEFGCARARRFDGQCDRFQKQRSEGPRFAAWGL